ncbi:MAG: FtsQ-type POTRA domain-containing protein [Clostridia bacterium]|nr:FtsQ-type POTRA domain-containing protein [Clostridia bacterium]
MSDTRRQNTNGNPQLSNNERIVNRRIQRNKRNRRKKIIFRSIIGVVFLVVGVIVGLSLFFNINKIVVSGDAVYSHETVIKASGVTEGDNLIFLSKSKLNEKISSELTYIGSVTVKRRLPSTLELVVKKTDAKLGIAMNGYFTLLDENGKVLEKDLETVGENIILLNLGEIESAELGETVVTKEEKVFTKLHDVLSECERIGLHDISLMDISDIYNIKIVYQGRITLELGETDSENLSSKLALGKAAIEKQDEENNLYRGTINLTVDGKGYWSEEVPTTEPQTEENTSEETTENAEESTEETAKNEEEISSVA